MTTYNIPDKEMYTISIDINHIKNGDNPKIIMIGK